MIKIKMKTSSAGPDGVRPIGWVGDVEDTEARALIAGGYADELEARVKPPAAQAVKPPAETAIKPPAPGAVKPRSEKRSKK